LKIISTGFTLTFSLLQQQNMHITHPLLTFVPRTYFSTFNLKFEDAMKALTVWGKGWNLSLNNMIDEVS